MLGRGLKSAAGERVTTNALVIAPLHRTMLEVLLLAAMSFLLTLPSRSLILISVDFTPCLTEGSGPALQQFGECQWRTQ